MRALRATTAAALGVVVLGLGVRAVYGPWPIDDAYITFRYARNLAAGLGFVYNRGEPVLGTTTPGFTLLLVPAAWLGLDLARVAWALGAACDALTAWFLYRLGVRSARPWTGTLAALLLLLAPKFVAWSSVSGMETSLYVLCLVAAVWASWSGWGGRQAREGRGGTRVDRRGRRAGAAVVTGLALWVRPDALLLGAAVLLFARLTRRQWPLREGAVAALVVLPWVLFSWWYFGSPVPASVYAKASSNDLTTAQSALSLGGHFLATWYERLLLLPCVVGLALTLRRPGPGRLLLLWGALYAGAFGAAGAFGHHLWYFVPLYVPYFWCAATGLLALGHGVRSAWPALWPAVRPSLAVPGAAGVLTGLLLWQLHLGHGHVAAAHAAREHHYRDVAAAIDGATGGARGAAVAATEVGALGWYYDGPVVDLVGLVTPEAVGRPYVETMRALQPRWLVTYDDLFDDPAVLETAWFRREWTAEAALPVAEGRTLYVFARSSEAAEGTRHGAGAGAGADGTVGADGTPGVLE